MGWADVLGIFLICSGQVKNNVFMINSSVIPLISKELGEKKNNSSLKAGITILPVQRLQAFMGMFASFLLELQLILLYWEMCQRWNFEALRISVMLPVISNSSLLFYPVI